MSKRPENAHPLPSSHSGAIASVGDACRTARVLRLAETVTDGAR